MCRREISLAHLDPEPLERVLRLAQPAAQRAGDRAAGAQERIRRDRQRLLGNGETHERAIAREQPSVIFLPSPNNPTGNTFSHDRIAEIIRCDFSPWPNVRRWLNNMSALPSWDKVHEDYKKKLVEPTKDVPFVMF